MGRSFFRPAPSNTVEAYTTGQDFYHDLSDTHFAMIRRDGQYYQRRWQVGFDGNESNVEELRIDYVMGSGNHARSYLHRTARGTLIELPFGWYSEKAGRDAGTCRQAPIPSIRAPAASSPTSACSAITASRRSRAGNEAPSSDPVFAGDLPEGIDCQRCHGPGGNHIRTVRNRASTAGDVRASIVNPARLSPSAAWRFACNATSRPPAAGFPRRCVRFNRGPFSFLPGEPLDAFISPSTMRRAPGTMTSSRR